MSHDRLFRKGRRTLAIACVADLKTFHNPMQSPYGVRFSPACYKLERPNERCEARSDPRGLS